MREWLPHEKAFQPVTIQVDRVPGRNLRHTSGITQGMMAHSPNNAC
jgi:hypothetical protein